MSDIKYEAINLVKTGIQSLKAKVVEKPITEGLSKVADEDTVQKVYANNLAALGVRFKGVPLSRIADKAKIDEAADKFVERFLKFLGTKSPEEALQYALKAVSNKNGKLVEALSTNIRSFDSHMAAFKSALGQKAFENNFLPQFQMNYRKYIDRLWNDPKVTLEELITLRPDWSFKKVQGKVDFKKTFNLGKLPEGFGSSQDFDKLCDYLTQQASKSKELTKNIPDFVINNKTYKIKRFTDGMNKDGVFLVEVDGKKYVLKTTKTSYIDAEYYMSSYVDNAYPARSIFNDMYLSNNNCKNAPKLYFYEFNPIKKRNRTIYEYIEPDVSSKVDTHNLPDMAALRVRFKDTEGANNVIVQKGIPKCVDNDDSVVSMPFELNLWGYNFSELTSLGLPY